VLVSKQRSEQRRDVGWLVVLVGDELSTGSARRRLDRGVATGRRQTVEVATGQPDWFITVVDAGRSSRTACVSTVESAVQVHVLWLCKHANLLVENVSY